MVTSIYARRHGKTTHGTGHKGYGSSGKKRPPSGYTRMYLTAVVGVIVVAAFFGWMLFRPEEGEAEGAACAILVDRTGSSINQQTRDSYMQLARHMVDGCRNFRASFSVYYFDNQDAKLQKASPQPFDLWRPKAHRKSTGETRVSLAKKNALAAVNSVFSTAARDSAGGHGSDIVTALSLASQSLQQQSGVEGVDKKFLVVLTDGYQTGELTVHKTSNVTALLKRTDQLGLVPQLSGVDVSFGGVGGGVASTKEQISADREARVKQFWGGLVKAGGGHLCVYNVEPSYLPAAC